MTRASGVGSWPGTRAREAVVAVRDLLGEHLPFVPELPRRGPGADMIGRAAGMLEGLHVETQPYGWRFVDRPGGDEGRSRAFLREDLDEVAEAYDGWTGQLKVQVAGPWTLGASVELTRGERAVSDPGARRDVAASLAEGVAGHVADVRRLVPGAEVVVQLDEPALPAVLAGRLPTQSGYGRLRAVDRSEVREGLRTVLDVVGEPSVVHCCAAEAPVDLLREAGAGAVSLDTSLLDGAAWEQVAESLEAGVDLWAGAVATGGDDWRGARDRLVEAWRRVGLPAGDLDRLVVTPACGLAEVSSATGALRTTTDLAAALGDLARDAG